MRRLTDEHTLKVESIIVTKIIILIVVVGAWIFAEAMRRRSAKYQKAERFVEANRFTLWMILGPLWALCALLLFITFSSKTGFHGFAAYRLIAALGLTLLLTVQLPGFFRRLDAIRKEQPNSSKDSRS